MSEETILKNSLFGGYKKSDVIQYIDEILEENDSKIKQMEEKILYLIKENNRLKANERDTAPIPFPTPNHITKLKDLPIEKQLELPEGSYLLNEDSQLMMLPEPDPIYQTKRQEYEIKQEEVASYVAATKEQSTKKEAVKITNDKGYVANHNLELEDLKLLKEQVNKLELEKQKLMAKLEYSNELLIELYKSKSQ